MPLISGQTNGFPSPAVWRSVFFVAWFQNKNKNFGVVSRRVWEGSLVTGNYAISLGGQRGRRQPAQLQQRARRRAGLGGPRPGRRSA